VLGVLTITTSPVPVLKFAVRASSSTPSTQRGIKRVGNVAMLIVSPSTDFKPDRGAVVESRN
jgi:hypothetical protein